VTEQTKTGGAGFVEDLGPMFRMWGDGEGRECLRADLIEAGPEEMARQFRKTAQLLDGLAASAEYFIGFGAARLLTDARWVAEEACVIAEDYASEGEEAELR
jgi:hypothetical protein